MKLKFRADKKDFIVWLWACLLLLLVVSFCVVNIFHIFGNEEFKLTFNIIKGFFPPYLQYTLFFWVTIVGVITFGVSNPFFEREKGFGFKEGKKETGYGRFAKEDEYKNFNNVKPVEISAKESAYAGFPLVYDQKKNLVYVDNGEAHSLVIGATGSGKTKRLLLQQISILAKKGESMVITDPKAEIFELEAEMLKQLGYEIIVVNFRDPKHGSCWNPYTLPYKYYKEGNKDKANELLNDMSINIATDEKSDDPFWTNAAADYLTGLSLGMFEDAKEDEISISSVNLMMTVGDEKLGSSNYMKEYFKFKDPASPAAINALGTVNAPQETKNSIVSVLKQKIKVFAVTQNLSEMLSRSDFDMESIGERKTAVFMIIQDEKTTYHSLATIFVKQCYESLISVAQRHGGQLPVRTNFLLDEFANMPKFKDITTMITAARSRQIRMTMIIQNFAQLKQVYGNEDAETIRGNCGNILYLLTGELSALEEISKLCGDKIVKVGKDKKEETRPLITVTELQRFKEGEVMLLKHRLPPLRTKFPGFWELDFGYGKLNCNMEKGVLPSHEQREIRLFDLREFVKNKREEGFKQNGMNQNNFGSPSFMQNPFGQPSFNPFINQEQKPNTNPFDSIKPIQDSKNTPDEDDLDIDAMIKKIDERIAELEAEDEADKKAQENEEIASDKKLVENNDNNKEKDFDILDDFMEDLNFDEPDDNDDGNSKINVPKVNQTDSNALLENNSIQNNDSKTEVYKNKEEIDKILNQKDSDDDMFDDFFE